MSRHVHNWGMTTNYYLIKQVCECGKEEEWHIGQMAPGWEFIFHANKDWKPDEYYEQWRDKIMKGIADGAFISSEYRGRKMDFPELLEMIARARSGRDRNIDHDSNGRAWIAGEFF